MSEVLDAFLEGWQLLCFDCVHASILGLTDGEDEAEIRAFLAKKGLAVPATATYMQVLSLFEKAGAGEFDMFDNDIRDVKFPVLLTSALHPSQPNFKRIKTVTVREMEKLFLDDKITIDVVVDLLHILASLTQLGERPIGKKLSYRHVLPSNIIQMAENA